MGRLCRVLLSMSLCLTKKQVRGFFSFHFFVSLLLITLLRVSCIESLSSTQSMLSADKRGGLCGRWLATTTLKTLLDPYDMNSIMNMRYTKVFLLSRNMMVSTELDGENEFLWLIQMY